MADNLADDLLSAAVFGLWTSLGADESLAPCFTEQGQQLKVALAAVIESGNDFVERLVAALTGNEHGELAGDLILLGDREGAVLAADPFLGELESDHGILAPDMGVTFSLLNYGTYIDP